MRTTFFKSLYILALLGVKLPLTAATPELFNTDLPKTVFLETDIYTFQKDTPLSARETALIEHVKQSIHNSWIGVSHILESTQRKIEGLSSSHMKHLLSSLCRLPHTRYLEIGLGTGSTFIAALHENHESIDYAVGIDNWSDGKRETFDQNRATFLLNNRCNYRIYPSNCFSIDPKKYIAAPINIYFYSGDCSEEAQEKAFTHYDAILDDVFITVIDGWNADSTRAGTANAINKLNYEILFEADLPPHRTLWWNGLYVAVIRKSTSR